MAVPTEQTPISAPPSPVGRSFIAVQLPASKLLQESYDGRKGAQGHALTGLGQGWGRQPLVLVRAIVLGLLLPARGKSESHSFELRYNEHIESVDWERCSQVLQSDTQLEALMEGW